MAIPVAMQTALLLLNHLNEIVFPPPYPHSLSVCSLIPKKKCPDGDFTHMSDHFFISGGGEKNCYNHQASEIHLHRQDGRNG